MSETPRVHVHLLPSLIPRGSLDGGVAVVLDVLRATTVMVHALAAGCESIRPCLEIDEARNLAASLPHGRVILGGERQGVTIPGFDLGNSIGTYTPEVCRGKTLVMTTTNGTRAILASLDAETVLVACFANLSATVAYLKGASRTDRSIHVVGSGTDGLVSLEDTLLAGAIVDQLSRGDAIWPGLAPGNDSALLASSAWRDASRSMDAGDPLAGLLAKGRGGQRVTELGLAQDIAEASRMDIIPIVARLKRDPVRIVAS